MFYEAFQFLAHHPIFMQNEVDGKPGVFFFLQCLRIDVEKINSNVRVHLQCGPWAYGFREFDIYSRTFEQGIIELARQVKDKYGDYRTK